MPKAWALLSDWAPLADDTVNKRTFRSYVNIGIPNTTAQGVLLGVYNDNGREQRVLTGAMNQYQFQTQALYNGIFNWLTYGTHLGTEPPDSVLGFIVVKQAFDYRLEFKLIFIRVLKLVLPVLVS